MSHAGEQPTLSDQVTAIDLLVLEFYGLDRDRESGRADWFLAGVRFAWLFAYEHPEAVVTAGNIYQRYYPAGDEARARSEDALAEAVIAMGAEAAS